MASITTTATSHATLNRPDAASMPARVLIAEDEVLLAQSLDADLRSLDIEVVGPANNGRVALQLAHDHRPDMALLDLRMPEIDGLEVARTLAADLGIPAIVISAYSDRECVDAATDSGVFAYLLKPVSLESLRVTMQVAWRRHLDKAALGDEVSLLHRRLEERKVVERAKGLIMERLGLSESDAMRRLQKQARDSRRPMIDLARSVIEAQDLLDNA
jgi:response regulator NasT